jgi:geranylgeranyl diphosphate synthase, type II
MTPAAVCSPEAFAAHLEAHHRLVDEALRRWLPPPDETPARLHESMRYSVLAGGKRIRPILCLTAAAGFGGAGLAARVDEVILKIACALELLHTYSLIHDDLPALDNDDLRRGRPTNHKVFGEALAILAGDALLTLSFQWIADAAALGSPADRVVAMLACFARAVGHVGMIGGQVLDIEAEKRPIDLGHLREIHRRKTGALIGVSLEMGALAVGAPAADVQVMTECGAALGLLFQIVDDLLDVTGDTVALGKETGRDVRLGKATYPVLMGLEGSRSLAREARDQAIGALARASRPLPLLVAFADHLLARTT